MNTATFAPLRAARPLEAVGFESKQAEAIIQTIHSSGESAVIKIDLAAERHSAKRSREQDVADLGRHCRIAI